MKKLMMIMMVGALSISLLGCQNMTKQDVGVITGGAIGGLIGSRFGGGNGQVLASVGGAIAGAAIGGMIGHSMDKTDRLEMQQALEDNKTNQVTRWKNPDNGATYTMKPTKTYYPKKRHYKHRRTVKAPGPCREYHMTATVGGKKQQVYGKACRQADGSWKVVK